MLPRVLSIVLIAALGVSRTLSAQVSGVVFDDTNRNGAQDAGEPGIAGVAVSNQDAVVTTDANDLVAPLHDRMPAVIPPEEFAEWLNPATPPGRLREMLRPYPSQRMKAYAVSRRVNDVRNNDPSCIEPVSDGATGALL